MAMPPALTVENLAVVESVRLSLGDGFTVLTGETGAGKSLVVDAVALRSAHVPPRTRSAPGPMPHGSRPSSTRRSCRTRTRCSRSSAAGEGA